MTNQLTATELNQIRAALINAMWLASDHKALEAIAEFGASVDLIDRALTVETPAEPEKPAVETAPAAKAKKSEVFGKVEQRWIEKDFVATWCEGSERHQTSGFATRAEANHFLKGKGVTVYPLRTYNKKAQFRS
jgi:hypothetical protein